jgi:hypothetical protein
VTREIGWCDDSSIPVVFRNRDINRVALIYCLNACILKNLYKNRPGCMLFPNQDLKLLSAKAGIIESDGSLYGGERG